MDISEKTRIATRNTGFFVWLGELNDYVLGYINIWLDFYKKDNFELWIDPNAILANHLKKLTHFSFDSKSEKEEILKKQDIFFEYSKKSINLSFDEIVLNFASEYSPEIIPDLKNAINCHLGRLEKIHRRLNIKHIQGATFYSNNTKSYYLQELMLRQNLAAASDLVRLSILYNKGGTYIDADTLPPLSKLIFRSERVECNSLIELFISETFINRLYPKIVSLEKDTINSLKELIKEVGFDIFYKALKGVYSLKLSKINFTLEDKCLKDSLHLSVKNGGEFNNNILRAHKHSRSVRIILKEISRRYKYIHNMEFDKYYNLEKIPGHYYDRLSKYRLDGLEDIENVTLLLTGPIVILEVLIGISYSLKEIDNETTESEICAMMLKEPYSIGITEQTRMTGQETKSSWLKTI